MNPGVERTLLFHLILQAYLSFHGLQSQHIHHPWGLLQEPKSLKGITVLPTDAQMTGFLTAETPARYFFLVKKSLTPVTVRVTPCESPLSWRLSFLEMPSTNSRGGSEAARHQNPMNHLRSQATRPPLEVFSYQGNGEDWYHTANSSAGLYRLDISSLEKDTEFQLFVSTDTEHQRHPLQLPEDPRVSVMSFQRREVTLAWNPSLGGSTNEIEYCVFVNRLHNYKTLCAIKASTPVKKREGWTPVVQRNWGQNDIRLAKTYEEHEWTSNKTQTPVNILRSLNNENEILEHWAGVPWGSMDKVDTKRICVRNQTSVTLSGLRPGTHYYFDVFAVHHRTGTSMAYTGTFAEMQPKEKPRTSELKVDEMTNIFLMSKTIKILRFSTRGLSGQMNFFIHSCLHKARLQIRVHKKTLVSQTIEGAQLFHFGVDHEAIYTILLRANHKAPSVIKLLLTGSPQNLPFQSLPTDTGLRVSDHHHACSSVTVRWTGPWEATNYCVYLRRIEGNLDLRLIKKHQNSCLGPDSRPKSQVVACRKFQGSDLHRTVTEEKIKGLKPGKVYLMDVYMFGRNNYTLKYPSRIIKTQKC
ncbi:protein NDNF-like [Ambystoma mexicanum]|uniref:protein NDNF-like n=1 Tax=Ambystoma mexicanum TaxID=8296 RepID=UPI0037E761CA